MHLTHRTGFAAALITCLAWTSARAEDPRVIYTIQNNSGIAWSLSADPATKTGRAGTWNTFKITELTGPVTIAAKASQAMAATVDNGALDRKFRLVPAGAKGGVYYSLEFSHGKKGYRVDGDDSHAGKGTGTAYVEIDDTNKLVKLKKGF